MIPSPLNKGVRSFTKAAVLAEPGATRTLAGRWQGRRAQGSGSESPKLTYASSTCLKGTPLIKRHTETQNLDLGETSSHIFIP